MGDCHYNGIKTVCLTVQFCVIRNWIKKIYFLKNGNRAELPNVD